MSALISRLKNSAPENVVLVCAGTFREMALEDVLAAGMLCSSLSGAELTDAARVACAVFEKHQHDLLQALRESRNGRVLLSKGREEELRWCAQMSRFDCFGVMENDVIHCAP